MVQDIIQTYIYTSMYSIDMKQIENVERKELVKMDAIEKAKRIRNILSEAFPQTKFSVRKETASCMIGVNVTWTDGPTSKQVEEYTKTYDGSDFYGEYDSFNFVTTGRSQSEPAYEYCKRIANEYQVEWYEIFGKTDLTGLF